MLTLALCALVLLASFIGSAVDFAVAGYQSRSDHRTRMALQRMTDGATRFDADRYHRLCRQLDGPA